MVRQKNEVTDRQTYRCKDWLTDKRVLIVQGLKILMKIPFKQFTKKLLKLLTPKLYNYLEFVVTTYVLLKASRNFLTFFAKYFCMTSDFCGRMKQFKDKLERLLL
jgi:hypothetical protein